MWKGQKREVLLEVKFFLEILLEYLLCAFFIWMKQNKINTNRIIDIKQTKTKGHIYLH